VPTLASPTPLALENYTSKQITAWKKRFDAWLDQGVDVYAYFKHEMLAKRPPTLASSSAY